ncbi:MAG TPA: SLBB domain-containing protein [candidate division Zixibacteria bacterium]|nr:SLBB domain-containing protein [candidate division Zixibacteria bacterium]
MNRKLLCGLGILILVSVYWFQPLSAQTTETLDLERLKEDPDKYRELLQQGKQKHARQYSSQPIFADNKTEQLNSLKDSLGQTFADADSALMDVSVDADTTTDSVELRPFGLEFFANANELTAPTEIPNSADYLLGPGDNVLVYLWGRVEREYNLTIDREGAVHLPPIGEVSAWGQTLEEFEQTLRNRLSGVYSEFEMNVTLGKIRSIRVYVIGEVKRPGAYTVSSLTTLINALYQAGGPTERGSFRAIKHLRGGDVIGEADLYELLIHGDNSSDVRLRSGDAVFVPVTGPRVAVDGAVRRPALYELRGGETAAAALTLAGGAPAGGYLDRVTVERIAETGDARFVDVNLNTASAEFDETFLMRDGDHMTVRTLYDVKRNFVTVGGMVKHPGRYERKDNMTLRQLLDVVRLRPDGVYRERVNVFRTYPNDRREAFDVNLDELFSERSELVDVTLQDRDSIHVYAIKDIERQRFVSIDGEVRNPGEYQLYQDMKLSDLIFLAGGFRRAAYMNRAELARTDSLGNVTLTHIDLTSAQAEHTHLVEDDQIYIRQIPEWELKRRVELTGEVLFPGEYSLIRRDETLWQLLQRAGGFTEMAFPQGLALERSSISASAYRKNLERIVASSSELHEDSLGNVRQEEHVRYNVDNLNRIILDMNRLLATEGAEGDVTLQPGDKILVPRTPPGISVLGAVGASGTIKFEDDHKPKYYLERAGGYTKQADQDNIKLVKADGRVYSGADAKKQVVQLGDAIIVPTEIKRDHNTFKSLSSMVQIISGLATSVFIVTKL